MEKRIAFINNKGGCGKSTSLFHVAGELAGRGYSVLVIDADKQCDTSNNLLSEEESGWDEKDKTLLDFLMGKADLSEVLKMNFIKVGNKKPDYFGIDVIPADKRLEKQSLLKDLDARGKFDLSYDFILIDCPPSNRAIEKIVLEQIADSVIVPMTPDLNTVRGYGAVVNKIDKARENNPDLKVLGIFFSRFKKNRRKDEEYREMMLNNFPDTFIDVQIPDCTAVSSSIEDKGQPIRFYKKSIAKEPYERLVDDIIDRVEND